MLAQAINFSSTSAFPNLKRFFFATCGNEDNQNIGHILLHCKSPPLQELPL
jgi:hypothetical protein